MQRKGPLPGKIFALCIPERRFAGLFGCMARRSCQSQLVLDTRRRYVARKGRFSRPRALLGYMKRENCHGLPPRNAPRENIATDGRPGTAHGETLPRQGTQERITREYRHCQSLESAFRGDLATTSLLRTHRGEVLPSASPRECAMATSCRGRPLRECISVTYRQERPRLPGLAAADVGSTQGKRAAARTTAKQATHRLEMEPCDPPRDLA